MEFLPQILERASQDHPELYQYYIQLKDKPKEELTYLQKAAIESFESLVLFIAKYPDAER